MDKVIIGNANRKRQSNYWQWQLFFFWSNWQWQL